MLYATQEERSRGSEYAQFSKMSRDNFVAGWFCGFLCACVVALIVFMLAIST